MPISDGRDCLCPNCLSKSIGAHIAEAIASKSHDEMLALAARYDNTSPLIEHIDFTIENGAYVFTPWYHLKRGNCCGNGCRNCPYPSES
jgi:hypothetical protein